MGINTEDIPAPLSDAIALQELLRAIIRQPAIFADNTQIIKALKTQGGIAKLEISFDDNGATMTKHGTSINTLKSHSNRLLPRGFQGIDELRKLALSAINSYSNRLSKPNKKTQAGMSRHIQELESQLENHQKVNFVLLQGLGLAINQLRNIRSDIEPCLLEHRSKELIKTLTALVTINPPPFDVIPEPRVKSNMISISDYKK